MRFNLSLLLTWGAVTSVTAYVKPCCPYQTCIKSSDIAYALRPSATAYCSSLLGDSVKPVKKTSTIRSTVTKTVTPASSTVTATIAVTSTATIGTVCTVDTVTTSFATFVDYVTYQPVVSKKARSIEDAPKGQLEERSYGYPNWVLQNSKCKNNPPSYGQLKSACSCLVHRTTTTIKTTLVVTKTVTAATPTLSTTVTLTAVASTQTCSLTITPTTFVGGCGTSETTKPTASVSGSVTCADTAPSPSNNGRFRIEGNSNDGTIFEGCIVAKPEDVTTPSGGTHECDGLNNGANASPFATLTTQIKAAGEQNNFGFDGSWNSQFQDFFITQIANTAQNSNQFWGVLVNEAFTSTGGCESEVTPGARGLWAFDAFSVNGFLTTTPEYAAAEAGQGTVTVQIKSNNGGGNVSPFGGASFAGGTSDSNGMVTFNVPTIPGCYQYKATAGSHIKSNAFYLSVVDSFS